MNEGTHALGNLTLNASTQKVEAIKMDLDGLLHGGFSQAKAIALMKKDYGSLHEKTKRVKSKRWRRDSFRFIRSPIYGTRCTTVFSTEPSGEVKMLEQTYLKEGVEGRSVQFTFDVKN